MSRAKIAAALALCLLTGLTSLPAGATPTYSEPIRLAGAGGGTEPRIALGPDGTLWTVTSKSNGTAIVYSSNDGLTWTQTEADPSRQGSPTIDTDIVVTSTGRILATELDFQGLQTRVFYSDDRGKTWQTSVGAALVDQDRQWLATGPADPISGEPRVYLMYHNFATGFASHNMWVATSVDNGATFLPPTPVTTPGSQAWLDLQCADSGGPDGINVNPVNGRLYVSWPSRTGPAGGCTATPVMFNIVFPTRIWTATSPDNTPGSWETSLAVDESATGKIVEEQGGISTIDTDGNMYVVYSKTPNAYPDFEGASLEYVWAPPDLSSWSAPVVIAPAGGAGNVLPHPKAGAPGKLNISWYAGEQAGSTVNWYSTVALVTDATTATPNVTITRVADFPSYQWTSAGIMGHCSSGETQGIQDGLLCSRGTDVWGVALDAECNFVVAWPAVNNQGGGRAGTYITTQTGGETVC